MPKIKIITAPMTEDCGLPNSAIQSLVGLVLLTPGPAEDIRVQDLQQRYWILDPISGFRVRPRDFCSALKDKDPVAFDHWMAKFPKLLRSRSKFLLIPERHVEVIGDT